MKKLLTILMTVVIISGSTTALARSNYRASSDYKAVYEYIEQDSTLGEWFEQYIDITSGKRNLNDFLRRLIKSEVFIQRAKRAGYTRNQIQEPIVTLIHAKIGSGKLDAVQSSNVRTAFLELDIALSAVDATIPEVAHEEFRREVLRLAEPLTQVASKDNIKKPVSAVEAMTFTTMSQKMQDRLETAPYRGLNLNQPPEVPGFGRPDEDGPDSYSPGW